MIHAFNIGVQGASEEVRESCQRQTAAISPPPVPGMKVSERPSKESGANEIVHDVRRLALERHRLTPRLDVIRSERHVDGPIAKRREKLGQIINNPMSESAERLTVLYRNDLGSGCDTCGTG